MLASSEVAVRFAIVDKTGAAIGDKATFFFGSQVENLGAAERAAIAARCNAPLRNATWGRCNAGRDRCGGRGGPSVLRFYGACAPRLGLSLPTSAPGLGSALPTLSTRPLASFSGELIAPGKKH